MLHHAKFQNYKALRDVSIDLERLTVLVGPNSSGKTSVLEGLLVLAELGRERQFASFVEERVSLANRTRGSRFAIAISGFDADRSLKVTLGDGCVPLYEAEDTTGQAFPPGTIPPVDFGPAEMLRLDARQLAAPSYSEGAVPIIQPNGRGLASVVSNMAVNDRNVFDKLCAGLRSVIPTFDAMRFPRARVTRAESEIVALGEQSFNVERKREYWGNSIEFDMQGAPRLAADAVSEGTLLVLGILAVIMCPNANWKSVQLLLLDDIDRALHPKAQGDLIALLRRLLEANPELQIVATSHSPYLLDHLAYDEVRITSVNDDGTASISRFSDHPNFEKWKDDMKPGEFWSLVGEKWINEKVGAGQP